MTQAARDRLLGKIQVNPDSGCWEWTASKDREGYGQVWVDGTVGRAHRVAYELLIGSIPDGLQLDHLCRVRHCVNPAHLEPVTCRVNVLRGETVAARNAGRSHCPQSHEYTEQNTYITREGKRQCRACTRERGRKIRARHGEG